MKFKLEMFGAIFCICSFSFEIFASDSTCQFHDEKNWEAEGLQFTRQTTENLCLVYEDSDSMIWAAPNTDVVTVEVNRPFKLVQVTIGKESKLANMRLAPSSNALHFGVGHSEARDIPLLAADYEVVDNVVAKKGSGFVTYFNGTTSVEILAQDIVSPTTGEVLAKRCHSVYLEVVDISKSHDLWKSYQYGYKVWAGSMNERCLNL
jgi:hypothetical protein